MILHSLDLREKYEHIFLSKTYAHVPQLMAFKFSSADFPPVGPDVTQLGLLFFFCQSLCSRLGWAGYKILNHRTALQSKICRRYRSAVVIGAVLREGRESDLSSFYVYMQERETQSIQNPQVKHYS